MRVEPVPQKAILVGMMLTSFVKWYANLYFHIPPPRSARLPEFASEQPKQLPRKSPQANLGNSHQWLEEQACGARHVAR